MTATSLLRASHSSGDGAVTHKREELKRKLLTRLNNTKILLPSLGASFLCILVIASVLLALPFPRKPSVAQASTPSFSFSYAGDYDQTAQTTANLNYIARSGVNFHLGLGDFNYNNNSTANAWSGYAKSLLPAGFPFEIVAGEHDYGQMGTYETELPDQIGNISTTCSACAYGQEYAFDYPVGAPLARLIMVSPNQSIPGYTYNYNVGGADYNWVSNEIDAARAAGIPWVIVGMHEYCFVIGTASCGNQQFLDLLLSKHVDVILQAQKHDYQASKQLALNNTTCVTLNATNYNPDCVVNSGSSMSKGAGSVILVTGTGGASQLAIDSADPKISYFRSYMGANLNETWGVSQLTITPTQLSEKFVGTSGGGFTDGFTITNGSIPPTPTPSPTVNGTPTPLQPGPTNKTWYFAEGRVGARFKEFLSLENPTTTTCEVSLAYLAQPDSGVAFSKNVAVSVPANTRVEEMVNTDLGLPNTGSGPGISDSAIVTVNTSSTPDCTGIVAERPMYFDFSYNGTATSSGSDVIGMTTLGSTFYFGDLATGTQLGGSYASFIAVLNPPGRPMATVTATYYANGKNVGLQSINVAGGARGTIAPNQASPALPARVAVVVTSNQPVAVERPTYFGHVTEGVAGSVSGAADVIGVQALSNDWLFAEGYTGGKFQENLVIANVDPTSATATVTMTLEFPNGTTQTANFNVPPKSQYVYNVNAAGGGQSVSAEVKSNGAQIVAEREMFFQYSHIANGRTLNAVGGTDVLGQSGPAALSNYSFAEGYVNVGYDEWLTIQNPTSSSETMTVGLVNAKGTVYVFQLVVGAHTRSTVDMTATVLQHLYRVGDGFMGYEVAMVVQSASGPFVAERPMYWNTAGTQGGSDAIGYAGGS